MPGVRTAFLLGHHGCWLELRLWPRGKQPLRISAGVVMSPDRVGVVILAWFILVLGDIALHIHPNITPGNKLRWRILFAIPLVITALGFAGHWGNK
jgi:hypothetical protein